MSTIHVTLAVDTATITTADVASSCLLYDSALDPDSSGATAFQINAKEGDIVIFHISAFDNTTAIALSSIAAKSTSTNLFTVNPITSPFSATVGNADGTEEFNIVFTVGTGTSATQYTLDPKIKVDPV